MARERTLRRRRERSPAVAQDPKGEFRSQFPPLEILSADQLEAVHQASLRILRDIGMDFLHDEALAILRDAGADVEPGSQRVRFDPALVEEAVAKAPASFKLHARNPANTLSIGDGAMAITCIASAPNVSDAEGGRRVGNYADFCNLLRLAQSLNIIDLLGGYPVEPVDLDPRTRHLDAVAAMLSLTDKPVHAYSLGRERLMDALELVRIARGLSDDDLKQQPSLFSIINSSSPLRLDTPMLDGVIQLARHNQVMVLTPFTLSGAMAPASLAGALAQQNAEALAGITLSQLTNPGAPVMYGGFTSNVDMKSGAPAFGTPEYSQAVLAGGQLARRYGIPYRSSNVCAANTVDAQAAYESMMSIWAAAQAGASLMMHGAGWMEGGLTASYEKMVLDADMLQMMKRFMQPMKIDDDELGIDAIAEVGPGGHFFGSPHTLERYETAFYPPILSDWRNFETWQEAGSPTTYQHANKAWKALLAGYEEPELDQAIREELDAFVARRTEEGGAPAL